MSEAGQEKPLPRDTKNRDVETSTTLKKVQPYPKSVFFIVGNEFCERFSFYGMRTVLILYLTDILTYTESTAKIIYHTFTMLAYFFPLMGAIMSDSWLGKFKTILYLSIVYAAGNILLALTSIDPLHIPQRAFSIIALVTIALGTGGIKPCVSAFGGDQFVLPQQAMELVTFFSLLYFCINSGGLISSFLTPVLRNNVHCLGNNSCYPLAFSIPGILMVLSVVIFALGKPMYRIKEPEGNVFLNVVKCIKYAISQRKKGPPVDHWLDRAEPKFGAKLVSDVKCLLKVLPLYIPLPIFSALYDQQGSGWTFQAVRMNGDLGFYTILPDQMQVVNPLLVLAFIPLFSYAIYPLLAKCHILKTPLQRMCCGGFLAAAAFAVSACVSIALENSYPVLPSSDEGQLRIYDTTNCGYSFTTSLDEIPDGSGVLNDGYYVNKNIKMYNGFRKTNFEFTSSNISCNYYRNFELNMESKAAYGIYLNDNHIDSYVDNVEKSEDGFPLVRTLISDNSTGVTYRNTKKDATVDIAAGKTNLTSMPYVGNYTIDSFGDEELEFELGGTYTVLVNVDTRSIRTITITEPNSVNMLWLLPQYLIITVAEILFSITGLEFSYSQAPASMKSVLQACFLLTLAFGNLIIILVESAQAFEKQSNDFFFYTGLMVADMLIFMWLAIRYKYVEVESSNSTDDMETSETSSGMETSEFEKH